jgi:hypothetical protein
MKVKPVPMKPGAKVETVKEYLARGGKITKCPEGKAESVWTSPQQMTPPPKDERVSDPIKQKYKFERTKPITGEFE